jgi:CRISPR system Cascade subunit CasE
MFLTRLLLDPRSAAARRDLAEPYDMHRTMVRAFAPEGATELPRILWRLEPSGADWSRAQVLVQSPAPGNWDHLSSLPGYLKTGGVEEAVQTRPLDLPSKLEAGRCYRFRLVANPTVTRGGKRLGLATQELQLAWLQRQAAKAGFEVETVLVLSSDQLATHRGEARIVLQRVIFEGVLKAADPHRLAQAMAAGIGPGKAFGCGLLSLGRATELP